LCMESRTYGCCGPRIRRCRRVRGQPPRNWLSVTECIRQPELCGWSPAEASGESAAAQRKREKKEPPSFLEFIAPGAKPVTNCTVEVESAEGGKLRLELKALTTTESANLTGAFLSQ
jgi:hypothetical protein